MNNMISQLYINLILSLKKIICVELLNYENYKLLVGMSIKLILYQ
jgi:hypothetical protein